MKIPVAVTVLLLVCLRGSAGPAVPDRDALFAAFQEPAMETRPFVRWWWNGGRISADEIRRELEVMQAAGIGGVEINTIAMPTAATPSSIAAHPAVEWLSPEWNELVRTAAATARSQGMTADLLVGSGWPFGGNFLPVEQQTQRVRVVKRLLHGPAVVELARNDLVSASELSATDDDGRPIVPAATKLVCLRLLSKASLEGPFVEGEDLLPRMTADGRLTLTLPAGDAVLYAGVWQQGFTRVKLGAPGAEGPVVNHFDAIAVRTYLDHLSAGLGPTLGGRLGTALRAMFIDSLELDHANWTGDLPAEFQRRRGYDLTPYLPFVLDVAAPANPASSEFVRTVRRARYDFCRTLVELFDERFVTTYLDWSKTNGVEARMQAYGRETHPLHGSMRVHLPEGESWLWADKHHPDRIRVESTVVNKYVSSAANFTGQRLRSFEAMTNAVPVFRETLQDFKRCLDATLLSGLNHPIIHGFNYTPLDAGFPGWVRFGDYLNERNPWWPYFRQFSDYAARLGTVMRQSQAPARIAVLAPRADEWARHGLLIQPFPEVADPWYQFKLVDAIQQAGFNVDYLSQELLAAASVSEGKLHYGPSAFEVLIVADVESLAADAAESLAAFAAGGGRVVFIGRTPSHAPGLQSAARDDARVIAAMDRIKHDAGTRVRHLPSPAEDGTHAEGENEKRLLAFATSMLAGTELTPDVAFAAPRWQVSQIFQRAGDRAIYFLANADEKTATQVSAAFPAGKGQPYLWDAETGTRTKLALNPSGRLDLDLSPAGSALVVFEPSEPATRAATRGAKPATRILRRLDGPWQVQLSRAGGGPLDHRTLPRLVNLGASGNEDALTTFSGAATYEIRFDGRELQGAGELDLGAVHETSEVELNGKFLGSRWWGSHRYRVDGLVRPGENRLVIRVTTTLANLMRSMKDNAAAQRWASWAPSIPSGLVGPVRLLESAPPEN